MARLTLAELEQYDGASPRRRERRFLCPLCGADKPRDAGHRSLVVHTETGAWMCHRCGAKGVLGEFSHHGGTGDAPTAPRALTQTALRRAFATYHASASTPSVPVAPATAPATNTAHPPYFRTCWEQAQSLAGTRGASYLAGRGFAAEALSEAGVRYLASFYGRPSVLFGITDAYGELVAVTGRFVDRREQPKTQTAGPKSQGVYATPHALTEPLVAVTEAPLDALALWLGGGIPALALIGTSGPGWLKRHLAFKSVLLATDADEAGERAASALAGELRARGSAVLRLTPGGAKDWAAAWEQSGTALYDELGGNEELAEFLRRR